MLDAQGDKVAESRHLPYGGERWRWPEDSTFPTDYRFTGQCWEQPLGIYYGIVNRIENWTSFIGTAAACWSDIEAGNTQVSIDSVTIGQDSLVSTGALLIGHQPAVPLEGFTDTFINVLLLGYDANRTGDQFPTYFEFHWEMGEPWYIMIYLNTAAEEPSEEE